MYMRMLFRLNMRVVVAPHNSDCLSQTFFYMRVKFTRTADGYRIFLSVFCGTQHMSIKKNPCQDLD